MPQVRWFLRERIRVHALAIGAVDKLRDGLVAFGPSKDVPNSPQRSNGRDANRSLLSPGKDVATTLIDGRWPFIDRNG